MISYRDMIALDVPILVGLEKSIFPESPWSAAQFKEELTGVPRTRKYVVAMDDNELVGYGGIALAGNVADIHTLTVIPTRSPVKGPGPMPTITSSISLLITSASFTNFGRTSACAVAPS